MLTLIRNLAWPRFIGITVGLLGVGVLLSSAGSDLPLSLFTRPLHFPPLQSWFPAVPSILVLLLSIPLYLGRDWARLVLLACSLLVLAGLLIIFGHAVIYPPQLAIDGAPSLFTPEVIADIRRHQLIIRLTSAGEPFCAVALQTFLTLGLLHQDVVRAFRRE